MHVCIFEDNHYRNFLPLAYLRPVCELRCGTRTLREKIEACLPGVTVSLHLRPDLVPFWRTEEPAAKINTPPGRDTWFVNARLVAGETLGRLLRKKRPRPCAYMIGGDVAAAFVDARSLGAILTADSFPLGPDAFRGLPSEPFEGELVNYPWEIVARTSAGIEADFAVSRRSVGRGASRVYPGAHILNKKHVRLGAGTVVKPGAVLDAEEGPVILGRRVTVMPNAVIEGPAFVGDDSVIKAGAKIYHGTSIGERCKVGGEVEASVVHSFSNKQHEGFLGHSYLGSWVNIGADTNTSDLKNTYGTVRVRPGGREIDTGLQFVGLTMGDHSKTGINVMFDTGTIAGVSCNLFGAGLPPKFVPSFSWGEKHALTVYDPEKAVETARRMMARREVRMSAAYETRLREVFSMTEADRREGGVPPGDR